MLRYTPAAKHLETRFGKNQSNFLSVGFFQTCSRVGVSKCLPVVPPKKDQKENNEKGFDSNEL